MFLILAETSPEIGIFSLQNAFLLASLTCIKKEICFAVEKGKNLPSFFTGKGFRYVEDTEPRKIIKEDISSVLFFKDKLSGKDKKILSRAKKKGIPTVKYSYMGENPADCDLIIDPSPAVYTTSEAGRKIMSGPEYWILHNKYIHFHNLKRKTNKKLRNILISAGDEFQYRELRKLTETLINHNFLIKINTPFSFKLSQVI